MVASRFRSHAMRSAEDRRKHHRERVRQRYYRTLVNSNEARALVKQLLKQRRAILSQCQESASTALQQYVGAIALADQLRGENQGLLELVNERDVFQQRVTHILGDWDTFASSSDIVRRTMDDRPRLGFQPLTVQDCRELAAAYYSNIQRSMRTQAFATSSHGLFGWSDSTQVSGLCINFSLQKDIAGHTATDLSTRSWQLVTSTTEYPRIYSSVLTSTMECLQVVDQDHIVMYERLTRSDSGASVHSVFLASRLPIDGGGFVEICQPLDASRVHGIEALDSTGDSATVWLDTDFWTMYQDCEGRENATHVTTGGTINGLTDEDRSFWMLELLLMAMRWENLLAGPRFCLTSG